MTIRALGVSGPAQPVAPLRLSKPGKPELGGSSKPRNNKTRSQLYLAYNLQCVPASGFFFTLISIKGLSIS